MNEYSDPQVASYGFAHFRQPLALILSDEEEPSHLDKLTSGRSRAALPFAGKYRLIDFALSNCAHSGIETVGVIAQYQPPTLQAYLARGRPWKPHWREYGLTLLQPYQGSTDVRWYEGTADAIYQNQAFVLHHQPDQVLVLSGDQICKMDLNPLIAQHRHAKADLTVAAVAVEPQIAKRHTTLAVDQTGQVRTVILPGEADPEPLAIMGVMLFSTEVLIRRLREDTKRSDSTHRLIHDVMPRMVQAADRVMAFQHTGYWNSVQTAYDYWRSNMDLLNENPNLNLQDTAWPVLTQLETRPPTHISKAARVSHSLIAEGCTIDGTVEYAILSPGVYVATGAVVRHAIVMHNATVEERALVENAILDMDVTVGPNARVGKTHRHAPTSSAPPPIQLTIVEKGGHVAAHEVVKPEAAQEDWLLPTWRSDVSEAQASVPWQIRPPDKEANDPSL